MKRYQTDSLDDIAATFDTFADTADHQARSMRGVDKAKYAYSAVIWRNAANFLRDTELLQAADQQATPEGT